MDGMCRGWKVTWLEYPLTGVFRGWNDLCMGCLVFGMSCGWDVWRGWNVLWMGCLVVEMTCDWDV